MNAEKTADNIARWLRDYAANYSKGGYVVGLSGGVDSAVAAALAVRGLGPSKVFGALMPCHSGPDDERLGQEVAEWLGVLWGRVDLAPAYGCLLQDSPETGPVDLMAAIRLAEANIKPRLRMIVLYYLASVNNRLVLGTGNLSELALGYFTKHGDGGVDVLPLGQLYKTEVWELAKFLGVPQEIIDHPPSAGLWPFQTDEADIGYSYAEVDMLLMHPHAGTHLATRVGDMNAAAQHKLHTPPMGPGATL